MVGVVRGRAAAGGEPGPSALLAGVLLMAVAGAAGPDAAGRPAIAAHRGGARLWPENSLTAFRGALGLGVDLVELDVHQTRDGEVVVVHDPTLDRTTTGRGAVRDLTWAELAPVVIRGTADERLPRLAEVLALLQPTPVGLLLEIKTGPGATRYPGIEERVLALVQAAGLADRTTVMAFDWTILERLRALSAVRPPDRAPVPSRGRARGRRRRGRLPAARPGRERSRDRAHAAHAGSGPRRARRRALDRGVDGERAGGAPAGRSRRAWTT